MIRIRRRRRRPSFAGNPVLFLKGTCKHTNGTASTAAAPIEGSRGCLLREMYLATIISCDRRRPRGSRRESTYRRKRRSRDGVCFENRTSDVFDATAGKSNRAAKSTGLIGPRAADDWERALLLGPSSPDGVRPGGDVLFAHVLSANTAGPIKTRTAFQSSARFRVHASCKPVGGGERNDSAKSALSFDVARRRKKQRVHIA